MKILHDTAKDCDDQIYYLFWKSKPQFCFLFFLDNIFIRVTLTTQSSNRNTTKLEWVFGPCERPTARDHFSFVPDNQLLYVEPSAISDRELGPT